MKGKKWLILLVSVATVLLASSIGVTMGSFVDLESSSGNTFQAWASRQWTQTSQADFNAGVLSNVDTTTSAGDVKLAFTSSSNVTTSSPSSSTGGWTNASNAYSDGSGYTYITSGAPSANETYGSYGFNLTGKTISQVRVRYDAWSAGVSVQTEHEYYDTGDDGTGLGVFYSGYKACQTFQSASAFTITEADVLIYRVGNCGTVTLGIYATTGSPAYPTPSALTSSTHPQGDIQTSATWISFTSLSYSLSANTTYAIVLSCTGGNGTNCGYWRCDSSSPTYSNGMAGRSYSSGVFDSSKMDSGKDNMFRTYSTDTEYNDQIRVKVSWDGGTTWSALQTTSVTSSETTYWDNVTSATTWTPEKLSDSNFKVYVDAYTQGTAEEVRLDWLPIEVTYTGVEYVSSGTIASQVLDTGVAGARWDALFWDETLQSNTDITFEVRAANSLAGGFPDASWTNLGSANSPITSGLPSGQYMQWRATLTTSDTSKTPILREVRVYHY
jgi:hypothetical protein